MTFVEFTIKMNAFLSKFTFAEQSILCVLKKSGSETLNGSRACLLRLRKSTSKVYTSSISTRGLTTSYRQHISFVYTVTLKSGAFRFAETNSKVYLRIIGELGVSDELELSAKESLAGGNIDHYTFPSNDIGRLKKVILRPDTTGVSSPYWFLEWVSVHDGKGRRYNFVLHQWMGQEEEGYDNIKHIKEESYREENPESATRGEAAAKDEEMLASKESTESKDLSSSHVSVDNYVVRGTPGNDVIELDDAIMDPQVSETFITEQNKMTAENTNTTSHFVESEKPVENDFALNRAQADAPQSTKLASPLSPAVRNLVDTYGIDMFKVSASGRNSRLLKGDVLEYMKKERITEKKFVVRMLHPTAATNKPDITAAEITHAAENQQCASISLLGGDDFVDHMISTARQSDGQQLKLSKFEVPHLYMSTSCYVGNFNAFVLSLDEGDSDKIQRYSKDSKSIILVRILSQSLVDAHVVTNGDEVVDVLLNHNGSHIVINNCRDENLDNIYRQYHSEDTSVDLTLPRFALNIVDIDGGVSHMSSILRVGQAVALNISGCKLAVNTNGRVVESVSLTISCDSRVIPEVTCALLLLSCKNYLDNPKLLGL